MWGTECEGSKCTGRNPGRHLSISVLVLVKSFTMHTSFLKLDQVVVYLGGSEFLGMVEPSGHHLLAEDDYVGRSGQLPRLVPPHATHRPTARLHLISDEIRVVLERYVNMLSLRARLY